MLKNADRKTPLSELVGQGYTLEELAGLLSQILGEKSLNGQKSLRKKQITEALCKLGMKPHLKGFEYIRQALELCCEDRKRVENMIELYDTLAEINGTSWRRIERNIRQAIQDVWNSILPSDVVYEYFFNTISADKGIPTNKQFLARMTDYFLMQDLI